MPSTLHERVLTWYADNGRELPWRAPDGSAWGVLVSEIMLQQTPVTRVLPAWQSWMHQWPTPADLASASLADVIRAWGRLGYPRRAVRLHEAAGAITTHHDGLVPDDVDALRALPGVGDYTAAAVSAFAYGRRQSVLDTNVRRVFARVASGVERPTSSAPTVAERKVADGLLPADASTAATWSVAVMELGALVCTARSPVCGQCPIATTCAWAQAGHPRDEGARPRGQKWHGTDRQARGRLMAAFREADRPLDTHDIADQWHDPSQRDRALASLLDDGLLERRPDGTLTLPCADHEAPD